MVRAVHGVLGNGRSRKEGTKESVNIYHLILRITSPRHAYARCFFVSSYSLLSAPGFRNQTSPNIPNEHSAVLKQREAQVTLVHFEGLERFPHDSPQVAAIVFEKRQSRVWSMRVWYAYTVRSCRVWS